MRRSWCWAMGCAGLALVALACGADGDRRESDDETSDCSTALSYERTGKPFVEKYCLTCHAPGASDRRGAPPSANFDSFTGIRAQGVLMRTFVQEGRMPPAEFPGLPQPSAQERDTYVSWLECSGAARGGR